MSRMARQLILGVVVLLCGASLAITLANRELLLDPRPPRDLAGMTRWLARHPADWRTASLISEQALDSNLPGRVALWRAAYAHAKRLTPTRTNADASFVRAGLFHWYELGRGDRALVLAAASPLLQDEQYFGAMHVPLWELTRDLAWLRCSAPDSVNARDWLTTLALSRGLFAEYRALREDVRKANYRAFLAERERATVAELLRFLPQRLERADEPMLRAILLELDRRPFEAEQMSARIDDVVSYAVRHHLQPLAGVRSLLAVRTPLLRDVTRAQAALELNDVTLASRIELSDALPGSPEWTPYYLDRARFEARRREAPLAEGYLRRAATGPVTVPILAAAEEVAGILGEDGSAYRKELSSRAGQPRVWDGACSANELCSLVTTDEYVTGDSFHLELTPVQSDATPAYVMIFIDDERMVEGEVRDPRKFAIPTRPGLHRIQVRLVNPRTRNGIQRRVRLS